MGLAMDDTVGLPSRYAPGQAGHHGQRSWPRPYLRYAELIGRAVGLAAIAQAHQAGHPVVAPGAGQRWRHRRPPERRPVKVDEEVLHIR
jgi:hypothetical protein